MIVELINTGSELLLGRTLNTHQQWLGRQLADRGYVVSRQVTVADEGRAIQQAVRESLGRADLILVTGGLGPTSDDLTRELIAEVLGKPLREDPAIVAELRRYFAARNRPMPARNLVQAQVPEGARVLANRNGTAPGLAMKVAAGERAQWLILLPGPPRELQPMFLEQVVPLLERELPAEGFVCHTLRTSGLGESALAELIDAPLQPLIAEGLELGYCARPGLVDVRLAARGGAAAGIVARAEALVLPLLAGHVYADDEVDLETTLIRELTERGQTLALAESCTGGLLAHRLTNVPGASAVLLAGLVTYANAAKERFAGVPAELLAAHGAVSEPVARALAEGARRATGADYAVAITGIAGPGGGTPDKPVGTVFLAVSDAAGTDVIPQRHQFDRVTFKEVTTQQALNLLWRRVRAG